MKVLLSLLCFALITCTYAYYDPFNYQSFHRPRRYMQPWSQQREPLQQRRMNHWRNGWPDQRRFFDQRRELERNEEMQKEREAFEARQAEAQARLEAERADAKARLDAERAEAEEKAKIEREERLKQAKVKACQKWDQSLTTYLAELEPLKLKPEVHRRYHHFDMYTVFVSLPTDLSIDNLDIRVQGPTLTLSATRPITIPKYLQGYDFCEREEEIPEFQTWERKWEFESPVEASEVEAEIVAGHKLKLQFPNPPEHDIFHIPILEAGQAKENNLSSALKLS